MRCMVVVSRVLDFTWAKCSILLGQWHVKKKTRIADFQSEAPAEPSMKPCLWAQSTSTSGAGKASFFFASKVCHMCYHHALRDMNNLLTVIQSCNALHSPSWMRIVVDIRSDPLPDATFHHTVSKSAGVVAKQAGKTQACWSLQRPGREGDTLHGFPGFWAIKQRKKFNQHVLKSCWLDPRVQQGVLKQTFIQERKDSLVLRQWFTSWTLSCCYGYQFVASMPGLTPNSKAAKSGEAKTPWPIDFFH